jgi:hypothetical protein
VKRQPTQIKKHFAEIGALTMVTGLKPSLLIAKI